MAKGHRVTQDGPGRTQGKTPEQHAADRAAARSRKRTGRGSNKDRFGMGDDLISRIKQHDTSSPDGFLSKLLSELDKEAKIGNWTTTDIQIAEAYAEALVIEDTPFPTRPLNLAVFEKVKWRYAAGRAFATTLSVALPGDMQSWYTQDLMRRAERFAENFRRPIANA
jgi:hypothetical protein